MMEVLKYTRQEHVLTPFFDSQGNKMKELISLQGLSFVSLLTSQKACPEEVGCHRLSQISVTIPKHCQH